MKRDSAKALTAPMTSGVYFIQGYRRSFSRLDAVRESHLSCWILDDDGMSVLGPETADDRAYSPNPYERFRFKYLPSAPEHCEKLFAAVRGAWDGYTSHGWEWYLRTHPVTFFVKAWAVFVGIGWVFCMNEWWMNSVYVPIFLWIKWIGPFAAAALVFDLLLYDPYLKRRDAQTEFYNPGERRWW